MNIIFDVTQAFYDQVDPRRRQEQADSRLISEDHNAMANLSDKAIHREFNPDKYVERFQMYDQRARRQR
jgi:hypothetical protein